MNGLEVQVTIPTESTVANVPSFYFVAHIVLTPRRRECEAVRSSYHIETGHAPESRPSIHVLVLLLIVRRHPLDFA
jgi:hypothetical protein